MKRTGILLTAVALLGLGWNLPERIHGVSDHTLAENCGAVGPPPPKADPLPGAAPAAAKPGGESVRTAYRLLVDGERVDFIAAEDLHGRFKTRRGEPARLPGMLLCRLLAGDGRILAEETLAAPDQASLIPAGADLPASGRAAPQRPSLCQVRLPQSDDAAVLEVYRVQAGGNRSLPGKLLTQINLPK